MIAYRNVRVLALALTISTALAACKGTEAKQGNTASGGPDASRMPQSGGNGGGRGGMGGMGGGSRTMPVELGKVMRGSIARTAIVSGVVEPIRLVAVNSQLSGALTQVIAQEGDAVRQGAVLAKFDDRELSAQLAAAEASYQVAEAAYQRSQQLRDRKVITVPEYERDRTAYASAKATYDQVKTRIGYATVRAPASGVITEKRVEAGDAVGNQTKLFTLADISNLVVRAGVSELDVVELKNGDRVSIALDALPGRELSGRIRRIFPAGDPTTRLVPVEVVLDRESAAQVRPGFLARLTFSLSTHDNVLLIPASALIGAQGAEAVYTVDDGKAVRRTVETGLNSRGMVEVRNGLNEGDEIVTIGATTLRDGMTIRAIPPGGAPETAQSRRRPGGAQPQRQGGGR